MMDCALSKYHDIHFNARVYLFLPARTHFQVMDYGHADSEIHVKLMHHAIPYTWTLLVMRTIPFPTTEHILKC